MHTIFSRAFLLTCLVLCCFSSFSQQQQQTINGHIIDGNANPVVGASVVIKSLHKGVSTDEDGYFSLPLKDDGQVHSLSVTSLGFKEKTIPIDLSAASNNSLEIVLEESSLDL